MGIGKCSAGACPPLGPGLGMAESPVPIRRTKPQLQLFTPWCAGTSGHGRLVRKHVPDSDPGCALQSTSMPALHRRNVPICRPMVDGGMRKCSARGLSPAGVGVGHGRIRRANSLYQTTTPAFHNLVCRRQPGSAIAMKACPGLRSGIDRSGSISFVIRGIPSSFRRIASSFSRKRESRGEGWRQPHPNTSNDQASFSYFGVPAPAGISDWYESMSRTPIRDVPSNQPRCRLSTGETCRIVDRWPIAE